MTTLNSSVLRNMAQIIYQNNIVPSAGGPSYFVQALRTGLVTERNIEEALEVAISSTGYSRTTAFERVALALNSMEQVPTTPREVSRLFLSGIYMLDAANHFMYTYYNQTFCTSENFNQNRNTRSIFRIAPQFLELINYQGELHRFCISVPEAREALQNLDNYTSNLHPNSSGNSVDDVQTHIASQMSIIYTLNMDEVDSLEDDVFLSSRTPRNQFTLAHSAERLAMFRLVAQAAPEEFCFEFSANQAGRLHANSAFYHQQYSGLLPCFQYVGQVRF